ncbi:LPS-assembly lipoprotein [Pacificibacter maritimus]|uniref:LPS-assembly lipoprotein n=1 Tax=Pacificibacter maritimus TaxID=762213 RepID=A0A3N4U2W4_9RHOB|nr:LPS assembly lipoprotein LptE [Pacificibacter maritimus]RPE64842.1 LPS-assembly lipoprotein [Pacificibacter maritimus]
MITAVALAGCGFQPAYGPTSAASQLRGAVQIDAPQDRNAYTVARRLEDIFARPQDPQYSLKFSVQTDDESVGITPDQEITRYHITGTATYTLADVTTGRILASGTAQSFTAYSATGSTVSSVTATRDATTRLMNILADQIATDASSKFAASE